MAGLLVSFALVCVPLIILGGILAALEKRYSALKEGDKSSVPKVP